MGLLNRSAAIVRPKQPFLDWLHSLPDPTSGDTLEEIRSDPNVYLLPDGSSGTDAIVEMVYEDFDFYFQEELEAWWTVEKDWPANRTLAMFKEWFDVEGFSCVMNLTEGEIEDDDLQDVK